MNVTTLIVGELFSNCYLITEQGSAGAVLIDPGGSPDKIFRALEKCRCTLEKVICTHCHYDHIGALAEVKETFGGAEVIVPREEESWLAAPELNLSRMLGTSYHAPAPDTLVGDGDEIIQGGIRLKVRHIGGHTPGSMVLYAAEDAVLFSGDTLFCRGIGRSDLPGGSEADLFVHIRDTLYTLPDETTVYPGHGEKTSIGDEKLHNPFVKGCA